MNKLIIQKVRRERLRAAALLAGLALGSSGAGFAWGIGQRINGDGKFVDVTRTAGAFHGVEASSGIQVELRVGAPAIVVHAEENIAPLVETEVQGGTLRIRFASQTSHSDNGVTVQVTAPALDWVSASGGAGVSGAIAKGEVLGVEASGGAELHLRDLAVRDLDAVGSGGATLELQGSAEALKLEASGGTRFPLGRLAVKTVVIDANGGSEGAVRASESVRGEASGGSTLAVSGGAKTRVRSSGGSTVDLQ